MRILNFYEILWIVLIIITELISSWDNLPYGGIWNLKRELAIYQLRTKLHRFYREKLLQTSHFQPQYKTIGGLVGRFESVEDILDRVVSVKPLIESQIPQQHIILGKVLMQKHYKATIQFSTEQLYNFIRNSHVNDDVIDDSSQKHPIRVTLSLVTSNIATVGWRIRIQNSTNTQFYRSHPNSRQHRFRLYTHDIPLDYKLIISSRGRQLTHPTLLINLQMYSAVQIYVPMLIISRNYQPSDLQNEDRLANKNSGEPPFGHSYCQSENQIYCCIHQLQISPREIGLNNVHLNHGSIPMNFCRGECNTYSLKQSTHSKIINHLIRMKSLRLTPLQMNQMKSCCSPIKYGDLQVQYSLANPVNSNNQISDDSSTSSSYLVSDVIPNIIITDCGCH